MPGCHLNDTERHLRNMWSNDHVFSNALTKIKITHESGFRGFTNCELEFHYPLTVVCGKNGTGKTTLLALASLGYHNSTPFVPLGHGGKYYTFKDFFHRGPHDADYMGVNIEWNYRHRPPLSVTKQSSKWMHYDRRPMKAVQYIGASRVVPAIERSVLKTHFTTNHEGRSRNALDPKHLDYLSSILERPYTKTEELTDAAYSIRTCNHEGDYSSFNMGAGEDVLIELLAILQRMPNDSLCVIEEIELGLHPSALRNLAKVLLEISKTKHMQFIVSSHSRDFLDAVPREARILLSRCGSELKALPGPTTRFAMGEMGSVREKEMSVYCEDDVAAAIISYALPATVRNRLDIFAIGSKDSFPVMAELHFVTQAGKKSLFYWDGDVTEDEVNEKVRKIPEPLRSQFKWAILAGNAPPERYLLEVMLGNPADLAEQLNVENANQMQEILRIVSTGQNHHSIPYAIAKEVAESENNVKNVMIRSAKKLRPNEFQAITEKVVSILDSRQ